MDRVTGRVVDIIRQSRMVWNWLSILDPSILVLRVSLMETVSAIGAEIQGHAGVMLLLLFTRCSHTR
jgi:hypothetical protein